VIVSLGGQTPLKLAGDLPEELILGTSPASIDLAEDRNRWNALCAQLEIPQPPGGTATTSRAPRRSPSGSAIRRWSGRATCSAAGRWRSSTTTTTWPAPWSALTQEGSLGREGGLSADRPVLVDRFLEDATEVDVDAIRDASGEVIIGGIMEHVEEAGVHSGDSACVIPPVTLPDGVIDVLSDATRRIAEALDVAG
jgi:carbamoyl-phosphate synthase large subunit